MPRRRLWVPLALGCLALGACEQKPQAGPAAPPPSAAVGFVDAAAAAGFDFVHTSGGSPKKYFPETMGGGGGFVDVDGDGWLDIYAVNGAWIYAAPKGEKPRNALYRQTAPGRFVEGGKAAGADDGGVGMGLAAGDIDNDGDADLYVSNFGPNVLLLNDGTGVFGDITARAAVGDRRWGTSCAFGDIDNDGDLDLYVANYVEYDPTTHNADFIPYMAAEDGQPAPAELGYPHPANFGAAADVLYRNDGDATFSDISAAAGIAAVAGKGLGAVFGDYDGDGWTDLYVANDATPNFLFRNLGDGRFEERAAIAGTAYGQDGQMEAGMGVDWGDFDGDGRLDLTVTNFQAEPNALYRNNGDGFFSNDSFASGMGLVTLPFLGFGTHFLDYDSDGRLDVFVVNGHVLDNVELFDQSTSYAQSNLLLRNEGPNEYGKVRFADVTAAAGPGMGLRQVGRGSSLGDYDNDGDVDVAVFNLGQAAALLRNEGGNGAHWLGVKLVGTESNRDAVGARAVLHVGGRRLLRQVQGGRSYLSHSDLRLHFGMGDAGRADSLVVVWPSGRRDVLRQVAADQYLVLEEGAGGFGGAQ